MTASTISKKLPACNRRTHPAIIVLYQILLSFLYNSINETRVSLHWVLILTQMYEVSRPYFVARSCCVYAIRCYSLRCENNVRLRVYFD